MILIDGRIGSREALPVVQRIGLPAQLCQLEYGDFAFEGNGPKGKIMVGFERKTLHDMLNCIDDARYVAHQRPGMLNLYDKSFLIIEGSWKPHEGGFLMEGFNGGSTWGFCKYRSSRVMYSKLRRYLYSMALSGVVVIYTRDLYQTAYDLCEAFHYFQKPWNAHTSLLEIQRLAIPEMNGKPTLVRRWAAAITSIGVKHSRAAEMMFRTGFRLADSEEAEWLKIPGIGVKTAQNVVKEIRGWK